jgi:hypothetical protein
MPGPASPFRGRSTIETARRQATSVARASITGSVGPRRSEQTHDCPAAKERHPNRWVLAKPPSAL